MAASALLLSQQISIREPKEWTGVTDTVADFSRQHVQLVHLADEPKPRSDEMPISNLTDLYIHELKDLYSANEQAAEIHARMAEAAKNTDVKSALHDAVTGIRKGMKDVEAICEAHGKPVGNVMCKSMRGLIEEAKAHVFDEQFGDEDTQDAAIISQTQRMNHYALAGYGTATAFAKSLGLSDDYQTLQKNLDNIYGGDRRMTKIAETTVNSAAQA